MSVDYWKSFEKRIVVEAEIHGYTCWKIPGEIRYMPLIKKTIPVKSHPDFTCGILGLSAFFDAKATKEKHWSLDSYVFRKDDSANKLHQWEKLERAAELGNIAGYLVWFYTLGKISWISVETIKDLVKNQVNKVVPETPGVISQDDTKPINLKFLLEKDLKRRTEILVSNHGHSRPA